MLEREDTDIPWLHPKIQYLHLWYQHNILIRCNCRISQSTKVPSFPLCVCDKCHDIKQLGKKRFLLLHSSRLPSVIGRNLKWLVTSHPYIGLRENMHPFLLRCSLPPPLYHAELKPKKQCHPHLYWILPHQLIWSRNSPAGQSDIENPQWDSRPKWFYMCKVENKN